MNEFITFLCGFLLVFGLGVVIYAKIRFDIEIAMDDDEEDWLE